MMKTTLVASILLICQFSLHAADAVPFAEAVPERAIDSRVAFKVKVGEHLYVKLAKGFLVVSIDDIQFQRKKDGSSESCNLTITHIEEDRVTTEVKKSFIVYSAEDRDGGTHLTAVDGTQDFRKAGIEFSWSYASEDTVHFYVPPKTKYAVAAKP